MESVKQVQEAIQRKQGSLLIWFDLKQTDCGLEELVNMLAEEWEENDREQLKKALREAGFGEHGLRELLDLSSDELKDCPLTQILDQILNQTLDHTLILS